MCPMNLRTPATDAEAPAAPRQVYSWAWMLPLASVGLAPSIAPALISAGWESAFAIAISVLLGTAGGVAWQLLHRREFVDRFVPFALFFTFIMLLPLFAPDNTEFSREEGAWALPGVLNGVVLAEWWLRLRRPT
jgi:hypothetical protein